MTIKVGDKMPAGKFTTMSKDGPKKFSTEELFDGKTVVLFSVPGPLTPTCDAKHLPGFVELADQLRKKGVDTIACTAVNDVFVMNAWGKQAGSVTKILSWRTATAICKVARPRAGRKRLRHGNRRTTFAIVAQKRSRRHVNIEAPGEFKVSAPISF